MLSKEKVRFAMNGQEKKRRKEALREKKEKEVLPEARRR